MERREEPLRIRLKIFGSVFFGKEGRGFLRAWHAVGVLEQRSGPDPTDTDGHCLWLFVWCGCVGCELYSGREHL